MQVRVRGLGSHARHARNRLARATPRPTGGDGDGPLADGRTPVECRAHCASSTGRQRRLARVEPVGRGGTNGEGVTLLYVSHLKNRAYLPKGQSALTDLNQRAENDCNGAVDLI